MKKNVFLTAIFLVMVTISNAQPNEEQRPPKPPTMEEHLKKVSVELDKTLELTPAQKEKVLSAYKTFFSEIDKHRKDEKQLPPPPPPPVSKEVADKLSGERDAKIKEVLTEEQYKKYVIVEKKLRPHHLKEQAPPPVN